MLVQLVGRDDDAGPGLFDFTAKRRIETDQMDVAASHYQRHSRSSKRVGVGSSSNLSSLLDRIERAAAAHPARGRRTPLTTSRPGSAWSSTSSGSCARSNKSLGTPREFPIWTIRVLVVM